MRQRRNFDDAPSLALVTRLHHQPGTLESRKGMMRYKATAAVLLILSMAFTQCGGDGIDEDMGPLDLTGSWSFSDRPLANTCGFNNGPADGPRDASIQQTRNQLTLIVAFPEVRPIETTSQGSLTGDSFTWTHTGTFIAEDCVFDEVETVSGTATNSRIEGIAQLRQVYKAGCGTLDGRTCNFTLQDILIRR